MALIVDFNTKQINALSNKMHQLHKSSFPVVVRQTLNNTAYDVKKYELLKSANQTFTVRNQNFFKRNSKVEKANGFEINRMFANVGILDKPETKNFHEQEIGGDIKRVAIPNTMSRTSKSNEKRIAKQHYLNTRSLIDRRKKTKKRPEKSQRVADYYTANKTGLWVFKNNTLFKVNSFKKTKTRIKIKLTPLYSVQTGRRIKLKPRKLIENAATAAAPRMKKHFKVAVNKQFKKYFK